MPFHQLFLLHDLMVAPHCIGTDFVNRFTAPATATSHPTAVAGLSYGSFLLQLSPSQLRASASASDLLISSTLRDQIPDTSLTITSIFAGYYRPLLVFHLWLPRHGIVIATRFTATAPAS